MIPCTCNGRGWCLACTGLACAVSLARELAAHPLETVPAEREDDYAALGYPETMVWQGDMSEAEDELRAALDWPMLTFPLTPAWPLRITENDNRSPIGIDE